jgi:DinB superfamily
MDRKGKELAERFQAFNSKMRSLVQACTDDDWLKVCGGEGWTVGVVARHVAGGHYGAIIELAKMIIAGKKLPEFTAEAINQMNAQHAGKHANCTKSEVLGLLDKNGAAMLSFVNGLSDADLGRSGHMAVAGGEISVEQLIDRLVIGSAGEHLASMKAAVGA